MRCVGRCRYRCASLELSESKTQDTEWFESYDLLVAAVDNIGPEKRFGSEWMRMVLCLTIWETCWVYREEWRRRKGGAPDGVSRIQLDPDRQKRVWEHQPPEDLARLDAFKSDTMQQHKVNVTQRDMQWMKFIHHLEERLGPI